MSQEQREIGSVPHFSPKLRKVGSPAVKVDPFASNY